MKTWHFEMLFMAIILMIVVLISRVTFISIISALAVLSTFGHASIAERLRENEAQKNEPSIHCYRWLIWYWISKELLWMTVFIISHAWPALIGCILFIIYPFWRRWWRLHHHKKL